MQTCKGRRSVCQECRPPSGRYGGSGGRPDISTITRRQIWSATSLRVFRRRLHANCRGSSAVMSLRRNLKARARTISGLTNLCPSQEAAPIWRLVRASIWRRPSYPSSHILVKIVRTWAKASKRLKSHIEEVDQG